MSPLTIDWNILWSTEHGARGGDEVNVIEPGENYGWPLVTSGMHYDGTSIEDRFDVDFDRGDIRMPLVDLVPSPAISSFVVYRGDEFPHWQGHLIVGSLKATKLFRFSIRDGELVEQETLMEGVGRIRDVEVDSTGKILLLIENASGGRILRLSAPSVP